MKEHQHRGLTSAQVEESRRLHGDNLITPRKGDSAWKLFAEKFRDPIIQVLLVAALLSLAMAFIDGEFLETIGIICAIVLATCVGFFFELDAMRRFKRLNLVNDDIPVKVVRDGEMTEVPRRDVVVGDLVYVENGETVPADGKLVKAVSLKINESTLTGEPEVDKTTDECFFDAEATYPSDALLRGTTVVDGYGEMIVEAVGDRTEAGRVTEQSSIASEEPTPLYKQLTRLSRMIGKIGIAVSIAIFVAMLAKAYLGGELSTGDWVQTSKELLRIFMVSVALIVMAVPEGLPMSITLSLALSMRRMLKTNNLVRKMHACETMGASYRVLLRDIYPALRHSDYAVRYTIRSFTVEEARELIYSDPRQLSLNEMFQVAQTMEPGSDAYREVFEIAVRMYPEDPVSNLNAALTAIDAGRLESARRYLAKTSNSAERTLAEAAIAMLENRLDEAEALLGKLSGDPSVASQVEENLRQIAEKRQE